LTLAIADDIGAIIVIAIFYSSGVDPVWLAAAAGVVVMIIAMRSLRLRTPLVYLLPGVLLWFCVYESGVHATIAGVALGLLTPARPVRGREVLGELEYRLHPFSSFVVVPLFALANAGVALGLHAMRDASTTRVAWGIVAGLVVGKTAGITAATAVASRTRLGRLPEGVRMPHIASAGLLAGIGFTVSLFIADLSFAGARLEAAKVAILVASLLAAVGGAVALRRVTRSDRTDRDPSARAPSSPAGS
jgi:NhaA family Na+:H+ antiporter